MEQVRFSQLYKIPSGNGLSRPSAVRGVGYKMVGMGELFANDIINDMPMDRVQMSDKELIKYTLEPDDLLFARQSLVAEGAGKCSIVKSLAETTTYESHLIRVRLNEKIANPWYYFYLFKLPSNPIKSIINQCAQAGIRGKELEKVKLPLPDINTQNNTVKVLSKYDELIELNNKRIKLLEQTAEELYKEWFVRFRFPNYQNTEFENGIPKGWNYRSIKEVYNTTSGGTPSRSNESFYTGNIPWIKTGELSDCPIIQTDEYITEEAVLNSSAKILKEHSLIIAMYGATIGKLGINDMPATCNQACCAFTSKQEALDIYYLYQYLKSNRDFLIGISNGAAQQNLSQDLLRRLKILLPPISIITQYNKIVDRLYKENVLIRKQNKNLIKQRDLLLPRLMSGKLEV